MTHTLSKRILSTLLVMVMLVELLPMAVSVSAAAEDQVIYIVADPAPAGKVFSYWTEAEVTTPGSDGWFGDNTAAETTYTVYLCDRLF